MLGVSKLSNKEKMQQSLVYGCRKYYKPFRKLTNKLVRDRRVENLAHEILYGVMERSMLKQDGMDYISGNEELAVDVCTVLDLVKNHLEMNMFKFRFRGLVDQIRPDFVEVGEDDDEEELEDEVGTDVVCKACDLTEQIYGSISVKNYFSIRKALIQTFGGGRRRKLKLSIRSRRSVQSLLVAQLFLAVRFMRE